uniref:Uncharacterized protein n=1 Tax=Solanum lycopersicum TaxID=4081 RepID=A0A3Q7I3I6_SOLLC
GWLSKDSEVFCKEDMGKLGPMGNFNRSPGFVLQIKFYAPREWKFSGVELGEIGNNVIADVFLIKDGMTLVIFEIGNLVSPPSVNSRGLNMKDNDGISKVGRVGEAAVGNIFKSRVATPHGFQFEGFISCIRKGVAESNLHEVVVKLGSSQMGERIVGVGFSTRSLITLVERFPGWELRVDEFGVGHEINDRFFVVSSRVLIRKNDMVWSVCAIIMLMAENDMMSWTPTVGFEGGFGSILGSLDFPSHG